MDVLPSVGAVKKKDLFSFFFLFQLKGAKWFYVKASPDTFHPEGLPQRIPTVSPTSEYKKNTIINYILFL
jgi:hypothetical protein